VPAFAQIPVVSIIVIDGACHQKSPTKKNSPTKKMSDQQNRVIDCPTLSSLSEMNVKGKWSGAKLSAAVVNGQCIVTANDQVVLVLNIAAAKSAPDHSEHSPVGPPIIKLHKVDQLVWTKTGPHIRFDSESTTGPHPEFWMELNIDHFEYLFTTMLDDREVCR
jgi:hypothetical protein